MSAVTVAIVAFSDVYFGPVYPGPSYCVVAGEPLYPGTWHIPLADFRASWGQIYQVSVDLNAMRVTVHNPFGGIWFRECLNREFSSCQMLSLRFP